MNTLVSVNLIHLECFRCGVLFAMSEAKYRTCKNTGESFFCVNGHEQIFSKSENAKLQEIIKSREELIDHYTKRNSQLHDQLTEKNNIIRAHKSAKTKLKKRIANGVCPCCTRHFTNIQRHIQTKHPEFITRDSPGV